jgi:hypothetical protein
MHWPAACSFTSVSLIWSVTIVRERRTLLFRLQVPELVSMGDEIEKDYIEAKQPITNALKLKILLCQNSGLILGVSIMFLLGKYGGHLENLVTI